MGLETFPEAPLGSKHHKAAHVAHSRCLFTTCLCLRPYAKVSQLHNLVMICRMIILDWEPRGVKHPDVSSEEVQDPARTHSCFAAAPILIVHEVSLLRQSRHKNQCNLSTEELSAMNLQ